MSMTTFATTVSALVLAFALMFAMPAFGGETATRTCGCGQTCACTACKCVDKCGDNCACEKCTCCKEKPKAEKPACGGCK